VLIGINGVVRLVADPEQKFTQTNTSIVSFSVVASEKYKDKESVCFIDCVCFGGLGEKVIMPYLKKGSQVYIMGKLKLDQWTAQDGTKRSKHSVTVESLQMIGSKGDTDSVPMGDGGYGDNNQAGASTGYSNPAPAQNSYNQPQASKIPEFDITDGDIPF